MTGTEGDGGPWRELFEDLYLADDVLARRDVAEAVRSGGGAAAVARAPRSVEGHRALQTALEMLGRHDEARARYRAAYAKDPSSPIAGYLYARVLPRAEALPLIESLVSAHPENPWLRRSMVLGNSETPRGAAIPDSKA